MDNKSDLKQILVDYHFEKLFEESGETDESKRSYWRERFKTSIEQEVEKMIEEEFEQFLKSQKRKPRSLGQMLTWTVLQLVGNASLAYSINLENIIFIILSLVILAAVTVWFWIFDN